MQSNHNNEISVMPEDTSSYYNVASLQGHNAVYWDGFSVETSVGQVTANQVGSITNNFTNKPLMLGVDQITFNGEICTQAVRDKIIDSKTIGVNTEFYCGSGNTTSYSTQPSAPNLKNIDIERMKMWGFDLLLLISLVITFFTISDKHKNKPGIFKAFNLLGWSLCVPIFIISLFEAVLFLANFVTIGF